MQGPSAIHDLHDIKNLRARALLHVEARCEDAARAARSCAPFDVVVLDPPRAGAKEVIPVLIERAPKRIVYVSCDLATLARDLGLLARGGYAVDRAYAFDMFPQTGHIESVVRLQRAP